MHHLTAARIGLVIMFASSVFCLVRGDRKLRIATIFMIIASFISELLEDWNGSHKTQPVILIVDVGYTALLLLFVVSGDKRWPQFAAVAQLLIVTTHLGALIGPQITRWDFFTLYYMLSYAVLAALLYGALAESPPRRRVAPEAV